MKNISAAPDSAAPSQILALSADYVSVPMRSPVTSIILAEAVRRSQETVELRRRSRPAAVLIRNLLKLVRLAQVELAGKVSIAFTPCGPIVYQWTASGYGPEGKAE
ncbi:MAG: hypothetical protein WB586_22855 [Chthoniobacterales bacterium]